MIYDAENFPDLPDSWILIKVSDAFDGVSNSNKKLKNKDALSEGKYPVIDQGAKVISGYSNDENLVVNASKDDPIFLFGDHTRLLKYIDKNFIPGADGTKLLKPIFIWNSRFAFEMLRTVKLPDKGYARHYQFLRDSIVPLPPLPEQKRIADKLDTLLARVDATRERLDRIPATLKQFRQAVLAAATSGALTEGWREINSLQIDGRKVHHQLKKAHEIVGGHARGNASDPTEDAHDLSSEDIPEVWDIALMRDVCVPERPITYGILKPGPELKEGISYIRVADFPGNKLRIDGIKKTSKDIDLQYKRARLIEGDLLLSIRGSVGRLIKIPKELTGANITQDTARLSISPHMVTDYVYFVLLAESTQRRMKNATRGVAVRGINIGDVRALQIPIPSLEEQKEIVRRVEKLFALADNIEARYQTARAQVDKLTPALLAKAFRGELVEQDPNDEPAENLMERVRVAKVEKPARKDEKVTKARKVKVKG